MLFHKSPGLTSAFNDVFPAPFFLPRDPLTTDIQARIGQLWINSESLDVWILLSLEGGPTTIGYVAHWVRFSASAGSLLGLIDGAGNIVLPNNAGMIGIIDGENIRTTAVGNNIQINVSGTTENRVQLGNNTGSLKDCNAGTDGQILIGASGNAPQFSTVTSNDGSITFIPSAGGLDISVRGGPAVTSIGADTGTAMPDVNGRIAVLGGVNINTVAAGNNVTVNLNDTVTLAGPAGGVGNALTIIAGDERIQNGSISISKNIYMPNAANDYSSGVYCVNGIRFISPAAGTPISGDKNLYIGTNSGPDVIPPNQDYVHGNLSVGTGTFQKVQYCVGSVAVGSESALNFVGTQSGTETSVSRANVFLGGQSAKYLISGSWNIIIGNQAGFSYTGANSGNIIIGSSNIGDVSDQWTTRIGFSLLGSTQRCFIDGINGVGVTGASVLVSSAGQLGIASSSRRYKENIKDIPDSFSEKIYKLNPVSFKYKNCEDQEDQYGLIAEEVNDYIPELVITKDGEIETVKYQHLPILMLNEMKKLKKEIEMLKADIKALKHR